MPLDMGAVVEGLVSPGTARLAADRDPPPDLHTPGDLGQILRAVRLSRDLDLDDLAQITRIRVGYLAAIEHMRLYRPDVYMPAHHDAAYSGHTPLWRPTFNALITGACSRSTQGRRPGES